MKQLEPRQIAVGVVILGLAGLIYLASRPLKRSGQMGSCQSNLKQIGLGMMQYVRDYDEQFPRAQNWMEELRPYMVGYSTPIQSTNFQRLFRCPATQNYYALNVYYDRISAMQDKSSSSAPLAFDFVGGRLNQADDGANWPIPPIHANLQRSGNNVLFGDGHVELRQNKPPFRPFAPRPRPAPAATSASRAATIVTKARAKNARRKQK